MTKEALAAQITGRQYGDEINRSEEIEAKNNGLLVIFGVSDDLCELRGAIHEEVGAYEGTTVLIGKDGALLPEFDDDERDILHKHGVLSQAIAKLDSATKVEVKWDVSGYSWIIETAAPHATFDVLEGEEKFCRGIILDLKELE